MSKLRLLFVKEAQASYISHLDLMRTFQRVFPRTGLSLAHSNGFHPHPIISIVLPLPVGQNSDCELLDFETVETSDGSGVAEALNTGLPAGLRARCCYEAVRPARELAALSAELTLEYDRGVPEGALGAMEALFGSDSLLTEKRTKHKELAEIDLIPLISEISFAAASETAVEASVRVAAQNPGLNPALIGKVIAERLPQFAPDFVRIRRCELYDAEGKIFR